MPTQVTTGTVGMWVTSIASSTKNKNPLDGTWVKDKTNPYVVDRCYDYYQ